ncbi:MBOAT, membrane-bound O-acyltransferase family-domain-containing protein [Sporodiniella umbellata]|nr:MBOAT, membrane-bound O-acyltransferase family-domain-containing protein [Sporodiniella umbellata]
MPNTKQITLKPSLWKTKEFCFYYVCFCLILPYMFRTAYNLSKSSHPNYSKYEDLLSEGWIFNRQVDNSDAQYSQFREHIPRLIPLVFLHQLFSHSNRRFFQFSAISFSLALSFICVVLLYGTSVIKIMTIIAINFGISRVFRNSIGNPICTWTFNLTVLFLNEYYDGYRFNDIMGSSFAWLDQYNGIQSRWHILFNFGVLRLISFNLDYFWAHRVSKNKEKERVKTMTDRERIQNAWDIEKDYGFLNCLAYVLYTPLLLCGPIITYNDFLSQFKLPSKNISRRYIVFYAIRLVLVMLVMELTLHYLYVVAISKSKAWEGNSPLELSMIGFFNLIIIWMKLLIPWRFFRLWSLMDGTWVEENMVRCMANNFSAQRFWKSWHRTFNRWTIRYIYIPLGGSKYMIYNMWLVFTFVALWHDIELKLLAWGWLISLFLIPEIVASRLFSERKYGDKPYYRFVCGVGAVGNILMMMIANLVGFSVGLDGVKEMLFKIFGTVGGIWFLFSVSVCLFIASQIMFEIRESEKRRGDSKWQM